MCYNLLLAGQRRGKEDLYIGSGSDVPEQSEPFEWGTYIRHISTPRRQVKGIDLKNKRAVYWGLHNHYNQQPTVTLN